jgi:hypothetical protein
MVQFPKKDVPVNNVSRELVPLGSVPTAVDICWYILSR